MTTPLIAGIAADLRAEQRVLREILEGRSDEDWSRPTPAVGWDVRDQVVHLAHFDAMARLSIEDPDEFIAFRDALPDLQEYVDGVGARYVSTPGAEILAWWAQESEGLLSAARAADPSVRVPWFGPDMSLASKVTARLMETWAHGQDIADTFGARRPATARLRHIARIGVLAFANSFQSHGLVPPDAPVYVALDPPQGGGRWAWGDPGAADRVTGPAEDFCLVVTQRRHIDDTRLRVGGPVAGAWMRVAQAFAGPPGSGREPGQFVERSTAAD